MSRQQPREEAQLAADHTPQPGTAQGLRQAVCSTVPAPEQSFQGSKERGRGRRGKKGEVQVSHSAPVKDNWSTTPQDPSQAHFHSRFSTAHCLSTMHRGWRGDTTGSGVTLLPLHLEPSLTLSSAAQGSGPQARVVSCRKPVRGWASPFHWSPQSSLTRLS